MESVDLLRELRRAVEGLRAFNEVGRSLTSTLDQEEVLAIILQKVDETLRPAAWTLLLSDEERRELVVHVAVGFESDRGASGERVREGEGIAGWVARMAQPVLLEDARSDPRFSARVDPVPPGGLRSYMAAPLRAMGRTLGVLALAATGEEPYSPDELRTLGGLADYAAIALTNARNFERVRELTLLDDHTGLYNARHLHRVLEAEVQRAQRFGRPVSLVFLDLDHFKRVNDAHGHQAGTTLLREVAEVMRAGVRTMDIPVRYGGDEFVVVLPETGHDAARAVAERLHAALRATPFLAGGKPVHVTASFGLATWPEDGDGADDLLRSADAAMVRAKAAGRDTVVAARGGSAT